jgi:hypothetical protein
MAPTSRNRRIGWTRFLVPDPAFSWYVRGVGLAAAATALFFAGLLWWYHGKLLDLLGLYDMLEKLHMMDLMAGTPPRELSFREDDQLKDLADIFNDFMRHFGILEQRAAAARARDEVAHPGVAHPESPARP